MYECPTDIDNSVGIDCGSWGKDGQRKAKEGKLEQCNRIIIKNDLKKGKNY